MGNSKSKTKTRASRPAGSPRTDPQPSVSPYAGAAPFPSPLPVEGGIVAPPVAARDADDRYALSGWGQASGIGGSEDVTCPSGQVALVKRPGVQGLVEAGVLHDIDSLTGLVDQKHIKRVKGTGEQIDVAKLMKDPESLGRVMKVIDLVTVYCVVKPKLALAWKDVEGQQVPLDNEERAKLVEEQSIQAFSDQVELDDKMFLFNYAVGGTRSLERFRDAAEDALAGVDSEQDVGDKAE